MTTALEPTTDPGLTDAQIRDARLLAEWLEEVPSRNKLMKELKLGADKARALRGVLLGSAPDLGDDDIPVSPAPTTYPEPIPEPAPAQVIERVPVPEPTPAPPSPAPVAPVVVAKRPSAWPLFLLAAPAFVALWSGWVGLGELTGFGIVHPLPGIWDSASLNTAITLPIGVESYAAYAIRVWLSTRVSHRTRRFAGTSAIAALALGACGQVAYHLMSAAGITRAPNVVTMAVACLPVAVVGFGTALAHMVGREQ